MTNAIIDLKREILIDVLNEVEARFPFLDKDRPFIQEDEFEIDQDPMKYVTIISHPDFISKVQKSAKKIAVASLNGTGQNDSLMADFHAIMPPKST